MFFIFLARVAPPCLRPTVMKVNGDMRFSCLCGTDSLCELFMFEPPDIAATVVQSVTVRYL